MKNEMREEGIKGGREKRRKEGRKEERGRKEGGEKKRKQHHFSGRSLTSNMPCLCILSAMCLIP